MSPGEFDEALSLLIDDEISPGLFQRLRDHLVGSDEAQWQYLDYVETHAVLSLELGPHPLQSGASTVIPMGRILARQKRRALRLAVVAGAAAIFVAALVSTYIMLPEAPLARFKASSLAQFELTHDTPDGTGPGDGQELQIGSRLRLTRGSVRLDFRSGVEGIVRAPADLTLRREDLVDLRHGTAWFSVPGGASGFRVDTPEFLLTDLGTEFGVISNVRDPDEVHVFDGQVKVQNHRGIEEQVLLAAGDARVAETDGRWQTADLDPEAFFDSLPPDTPLPPYLYWSFDRDKGPGLPAGGTHPDRQRISASSVNGSLGTVAGKVGEAVSFDGLGAQLHTDWPGIAGGNPRTVAFWLKLPPAPAGDPGDKNYSFTLVHWGTFLRGGNTEWAVRATNEKYAADDLYTPGDTTRINLYLGSGWFNGSTEIADGEWHHIAVRYNGVTDARGAPVVAIFVDGRREQTSYISPRPPVPIDTEVGVAGARPLGVAISRSGRSAPFPGEIDELYIFDGKVEDGTIRDLFVPR